MIIFDLDDTLADCEHRRHFVNPSKRSPNGLFMNEDRGDGFYFKRDPQTLEVTKEPFKPDWQAFYEACSEDTPIEPVIEMFHCLLAQEKKVQIWSGRWESVRDKTEDWLIEHVFIKYCSRFDLAIDLKMRPIGDSTPDDVLKERLLDEAIAEGKSIDFVFDDRPKVIRMWRRRGIFVFNCCQHDKEF